MVLEHEKRLLRESGRPELAAKVCHVSAIEEEGVGYDILSFAADGAEKYIEVKTTTTGINSAFYLASNELAFGEKHALNYYLYRVYDFDPIRNTGKLYLVRGPVSESFALTAVNYRVTPALNVLG